MSGPFQQTLENFQKDIKGEKVSVEQMLQLLNNRGFGALLLLPCLIELFPTGIIPGVPSICATIIILLTVQILFGKRYPWMPPQIRNKKFDHKKINEGLDKAFPYIHWIDRKSRERFAIFSSTQGERLAALAIITLALTIYPLELIPFASSIPSFVIALFAIGFLTKDGIILSVAWILAAAAIIGIVYLLYTYLI
jgi:hypothetical protein